MEPLVQHTKEKFLEEHNRLSPDEFKTTKAVLTRFRKEKKALFSDRSWPVERLRRPFVSWLASLPIHERQADE